MSNSISTSGHSLWACGGRRIPLKNLLVNVKRKAHADLGFSISGAWIVCDVDEWPHVENLQKWLTEQSSCHAGGALASRAWFVYLRRRFCLKHCKTNGSRNLREEMVIPEWLIDQTDEACLQVQ